MGADDRDGLEWSTMTVPRDVLTRLGILAAMEGMNLRQWADTELRQIVDTRYARRVKAEAKALHPED